MIQSVIFIGHRLKIVTSYFYNDVMLASAGEANLNKRGAFIYGNLAIPCYKPVKSST